MGKAKAYCPTLTATYLISTGLIFGCLLAVAIFCTVRYDQQFGNYAYINEAVCHVYNATAVNLTCGSGCNTVKVDCSGPTRACLGTRLDLIVGKKLLQNPEVAKGRVKVPYLAVMRTWGVDEVEANETLTAHPQGWSGKCYYDEKSLEVFWWSELPDDTFLGPVIVSWVLLGLLFVLMLFTWPTSLCCCWCVMGGDKEIEEEWDKIYNFWGRALSCWGRVELYCVFCGKSCSCGEEINQV